MDFQQDPRNMNAIDYKRYHESFMQNNHGSTAPHVFFCIFFTVQCSIYASIRLKNNSTSQYFFEYIIIVLPLIMALTILAEYIYTLNFVITTIVIYEFYKSYSKTKHKFNPLLENKKMYSVSMMRGLTYLITVLCILAVDFKEFPRYLAKTERHGFSLMDTGVGLFVLMSGLVHKDLRKHSLINIVKGNLKFFVILMFLGIARYLSVKQLDYQEHVTEYGVHWNFFFTLAVCKLLSTVIMYCTSNAFKYSFIVQATHEIILYLGLQEWVFSNTPRDTIFSANREGISSSLGYVSLYLFAAHIKQVLSETTIAYKIKLFNSTFIVTTAQIKFIFESVLSWVFFCMINAIKPISRTLANCAYCIYLEAILVTVVAILHFFETFLSGENCHLKVPMIIENINNNGLAYFLAANLMTGAVNLSIRTLTASSISTFIILNVYMIMGLTLIGYLKNKGIKI